jgi:hypothetical protein
VVLGRKREPAAGIKPEKSGWQLLLGAELAGSTAELQDITPDMPPSRWAVPVAEEKVVLDTERFLPTHVYRVEFRRERQLLGTALIYLYPPPEKKKEHVEFADDKAPEDKPSELAPTPKGDLPDDRPTASRGKNPR